MNAQLGKRRRNDPNPQDDTDNFDLDGSAQGAKHWTDDEKTRLFEWLMGPGQEEHWNALRATKNSCLREVCRLCQKQIKSFFDLFSQSVPTKFLEERRLTRL
jgi:hypothetical protein